MDPLAASIKLKGLLESHEKAVSRIEDLEKSIAQLTKNLVSGKARSHARHAHLLIQRKCILLGLREMYVVYRSRKWREFKAYVDLITAILDPENDNDQHWEDPGPFPSDVHEVTNNARVFSIEFCEMNRGW